jgi:tRNA(Arg) A34 adenosine deaminase TadA
MASTEDHLRMAVELALANVREQGGRPFGAVIVKDGVVVATGVNETQATHDPTAHAEMQAIRAASRALGSPRLDGCVVHASGQPCPMCLAAMHLAGVSEVWFAYSNADGEPFGLSTASVYAELAKPLEKQSMRIGHRPVRSEAGDPYEAWRQRRGGA